MGHQQNKGLEVELLTKMQKGEQVEPKKSQHYEFEEFKVTIKDFYLLKDSEEKKETKTKGWKDQLSMFLKFHLLRKNIIKRDKWVPSNCQKIIMMVNMSDRANEGLVEIWIWCRD